jgi:hypothetical protein
MAKEFGYVNVYGQEFYHSEATICGDIKGLTDLRDTIDKVLAAGENSTETTGAFSSDGEGYDLQVILLPDDKMARVTPRYHDEFAPGPGHSSFTGPWDLV